MKDPVRFSFTPTRSDYFKTLRAFSFRQTRLRIVMVVFSLLFILVSVSSAVFLHSFPLTGFLLLLFLLVLFISTFFLGPANIADRVAKDVRLSAETTWEVDENKVAIRNQFADTNCDWGTFGETYETVEHLLITYSTNKNIFQLIPKRAFVSADQEAEFRSLLEEKTQKITQIRSVRLPELSRRTVSIFLYGILIIFIIIIAASSFMQASGM